MFSNTSQLAINPLDNYLIIPNSFDIYVSNYLVQSTRQDDSPPSAGQSYTEHTPGSRIFQIGVSAPHHLLRKIPSIVNSSYFPLPAHHKAVAKGSLQIIFALSFPERTDICFVGHTTIAHVWPKNRFFHFPLFQSVKAPIEKISFQRYFFLISLHCSTPYS